MNNLSQEEETMLETALNEAYQEIPTNYDPMKVRETTSRFSGAAWFEEIQKKTVLVAGVGGIGSWFVFLLARMRPDKIIIYDDDLVDLTNMSGQLYGMEHVGRKKVSALAQIVRQYSDYHRIFEITELFTSISKPSDIMVCGFDNMLSRKVFFQSWHKHVLSKPREEWKNCLFIDARLASEELQIFCLTGDDFYSISAYHENYLFDDTEAIETQCSLKQTSYCANLVAGFMINLFVNYCTLDTDMTRDIPFLTTYNAELMLFKTKIL